MSENDRKQIKCELNAKEIDEEQYEKFLETWEDCQQEFNERMNAYRNYGLSEALVIADINYDENIYDALVDDTNTALLFIKMKKEKVLKLNKHYNDDTDIKTFTYNPFANL